MIDLNPHPYIGNIEQMKCNCNGIDEEKCDYLLEDIKRELDKNIPSNFKIDNIKRMIEDFNH